MYVLVSVPLMPRDREGCVSDTVRNKESFLLTPTLILFQKDLSSLLDGVTPEGLHPERVCLTLCIIYQVT